MEIKMVIGFQGVPTKEIYWAPGEIHDASVELSTRLIASGKAVAVKEVLDVDSLDLEKLTVKELKSVAKELGLEGYSRLSKDELIAAIEGV